MSVAGAQNINTNLWKEIKTFVYPKDDEHIYNVTKGFCFKSRLFF